LSEQKEKRGPRAVLGEEKYGLASLQKKLLSPNTVCRRGKVRIHGAPDLEEKNRCFLACSEEERIDATRLQGRGKDRYTASGARIYVWARRKRRLGAIAKI